MLMIIFSSCKTMMLNLYNIKVKIKEIFFIWNFEIIYFAKFEEIHLRDHLTCNVVFFFSTRSKNLYWISLFQIMHPGIENYFEGFDGAQYIPRPWLKAVFPHDWPWPYVISPWHFLIFLTFVKKCIYGYIRGMMQIEFIFLELLWFFGYILIYLNRVAGNFIFLCKINTGTFN